MPKFNLLTPSTNMGNVLNPDIILIHQYQHIGGGQTYVDQINLHLKKAGYHTLLLQDNNPTTVIKTLLSQRQKPVLWFIYQEYNLYLYLFSWIIGANNILIILNVWMKEAYSSPYSNKRIHPKIIFIKCLWWFKQLITALVSDSLAYLTKYERNLFLSLPAYSILKRKKSTIIYGGVDRNYFSPISKKQKLNLRHLLGIHPFTTMLVVAGRVDPRKNYEDALKIISKMKTDYPSFILYCIFSSGNEANDNDYLQFLLRLINKYQIPHHVRFIFDVSHQELAQYYQVADAFIMTSKTNEPLGLVTLEALATNCPVFGYNTCALPELVPDKYPYLASTNSPAQLYSLLKNFLSLPPQTQKLSTHKLSLSIKQFTWHFTTQAIIKLLNHE